MDDAYLYRFEEERLLLVVNAANTEKDLMHLRSVVKDYDCTITDITSRWASIAVPRPQVQGSADHPLRRGTGDGADEERFEHSDLRGS